MATVTLTAGASATTLSSSAEMVQVRNIGTGNAVVSPGGITLRPGRYEEFQSEGRTVTAYSLDGTSLDVLTAEEPGIDREIDGGTP